jgi:hypothetical protein
MNRSKAISVVSRSIRVYRSAGLSDPANDVVREAYEVLIDLYCAGPLALEGNPRYTLTQPWTPVKTIDGLIEHYVSLGVPRGQVECLLLKLFHHDIGGLVDI